jgi:hypothetical protein
VRPKPLPPAPQCFEYGNDLRNGAFIIPRKNRNHLRVIVSDGTDWTACGFPPPAFEHVSVSLAYRCPTWDEMEYVKSLFWGDDETVIQYHVPRRQHVNFHPHCLHLWKPVGIVLPMPPTAAVGPLQEAQA